MSKSVNSKLIYLTKYGRLLSAAVLINMTKSDKDTEYFSSVHFSAQNSKQMGMASRPVSSHVFDQSKLSQSGRTEFI